MLQLDVFSNSLLLHCHTQLIQPYDPDTPQQESDLDCISEILCCMPWGSIPYIFLPTYSSPLLVSYNNTLITTLCVNRIKVASTSAPILHTRDMSCLSHGYGYILVTLSPQGLYWSPLKTQHGGFSFSVRAGDNTADWTHRLFLT